MKTMDMLNAHPKRTSLDLTVVSECVNALVECADVCTSCADACLGEEQVQMLARCIRLNLDCADICQTEPAPLLLRAQLDSCAIACRACAQECEVHSEMHQHCRICRASCLNCEKICQEMLSRLSEGSRTSLL